MDHKHFDKLKKELLPNSEALVTGEISLPFLVEVRKSALKELNGKTALPGFRPGHIPEEILVKNLGEMRILEESAEIALGTEYQNIMKGVGLSPIGRPDISVTKLAPGVPLEFKIKVYLEPEFTLPDYKSVAAKVMSEEESVEVTEKEIEDVREEINKREIKPDLKEGEDLNQKIKENLTEEKKFRAREKKRLMIVEELVKATKIALPRILVESELQKMMAQFKDDVSRFGLTWEKYLETLKKSEEEVRKDWEEKARERVKAELIIMKIAETEKIEPKVDELEHETTHLLSHYPDADPLRARLYVYELLRNQKVLEFLEGLK